MQCSLSCRSSRMSFGLRWALLTSSFSMALKTASTVARGIAPRGHGPPAANGLFEFKKVPKPDPKSDDSPGFCPLSASPSCEATKAGAGQAVKLGHPRGCPLSLAAGEGTGPGAFSSKPCRVRACSTPVKQGFDGKTILTPWTRLEKREGYAVNRAC